MTFLPYVMAGLGPAIHVFSTRIEGLAQFVNIVSL